MRPARGAPVVRIASLFVTANAARAELAIVPDTSGHIGAWLSAGSPIDQHFQRLDLAKLHPSLGQALPGIPWIRWRLTHVADGAIDLTRYASAGARASVLLAATLTAKRELDLLLLLSVDGALSGLHRLKAVGSRCG